MKEIKDKKSNDRVFFVSTASLHRIRDIQQSTDRSTQRCFRDLAFKLVSDAAPKFSLSGLDPSIRLECAVGDWLYERLYQVAKNFGVPPVAIGEMIGSYVVKEIV
ncbi:hypothetical protein [Burkholderia territorii]|uniref:hypothetical protein n=1 Tax=Burkholderia territorii TaxID=1503055 RepID=UPI000A51DC09|nr:hypothetical protein [Burkholderia territorii]